MRHFTKWYDPSIEDYPDSQTYIREFSGRMTKKRWKIIQGMCRQISGHRPHCGCEHDCCGCVCGTSMNAEYKHNQVTIFYHESYNY